MPTHKPGVLITINVRFDSPFKEAPRVKILEPSNAAVGEITKDGFVLRTSVNPVKVSELSIKYTANFKEFSTVALLQFCPACYTPLKTWPEVRPAGFTHQGTVVPSLPMSFCPECGNVFVSRKNLKALSKEKESKIIIPAGVIVGSKR